MPTAKSGFKYINVIEQKEKAVAILWPCPFSHAIARGIPLCSIGFSIKQKNRRQVQANLKAVCQ
jgi:hypothetical protein